MKQKMLLAILLLWIFWVPSTLAKENSNQPVSASHSLAPMIPLKATVSNATVFPSQSFCVDVSVSDFTEIVSLQFSMGWGNTHLQFDSVVNVNSPFPDDLQFGTSLTDVGLLTISGQHPLEQGTTLVDGTILFRLCFTVIGPLGDCTALAITGFPLGIEVTQEGSAGTDIGLDAQNGNICIVEPLQIQTDALTALDCQSIDAGWIQTQVNGGSTPYTYQWTSSNNFTSTNNNLTQLSPGLYFLSINDDSNPPLVYLDTFEITGDFDLPLVSLSASGTINCVEVNSTLTAEVNTDNDPFLLSWSSLDGQFVGDTDGLEVLVDAEGTYWLTIENEINHCKDSVHVFVEANLLSPVADAGPSVGLNCEQTSFSLGGGNTSIGAAFFYEWTTSNGQLPSISNQNVLEINTAGNYQLVVIDSSNFCRDTAAVVVNENFTQPNFILSGDTLLNCELNQIVLQASLMPTNQNLSYVWTTPNGHFLTSAQNLEVLIDQAGLYQFEIQDNESLCRDTGLWEVRIDTLVPIANILGDSVVNCVDYHLDLAAQSIQGDSTWLYFWTTDGGNILTDPLQKEVEITGAGPYQLRVRNPENACVDSSLFIITEDNRHLLAATEPNRSLCERQTSITANLPEGTTGYWKRLDDGILFSPDQPIAEVEDLIEGNNVLVWTLSTPVCPEYDADTLTLNVETLPLAQDDVFGLPPLNLPQNINVIANDGINVTENWQFNLLSSPSFGDLSEVVPGVLSYSNPNLELGTLDFDYELCNSFCPELCDSAKVLLTIRPELLLDSTLVIPSGITPNDDGINDQFVIPLLEPLGSQYSENELIVFNRWGDVVYRAKPYLNNWMGQGPSGTLLPQGTYYYLLRLSLSQGLLYRGEITILR
ncbi:MAG: gliding motility-associated C-terminal domain-containing protein [Bacteroidota bacterium]